MDYAGSSPVDPRVKEAMEPYFEEVFGNPSSMHSVGREAGEALDRAREQVANLVNAQNPRNIVFTSGATESTNLAIKGIALRSKEKKHILVSAIEHISVTNVCRFLQKQGFNITTLPVDNFGFADLEALKEAITKDTALISVMYANNEIGTIEPVKDVGEIATDNKIPFHCDGTAACGKIPVDVQENNIDLMTISSNDMYGPKGMGALYINDGIRLDSWRRTGKRASLGHRKPPKHRWHGSSCRAGVKGDGGGVKTADRPSGSLNKRRFKHHTEILSERSSRKAAAEQCAFQIQLHRGGRHNFEP
jgi:cysteine desulfurase